MLTALSSPGGGAGGSWLVGDCWAESCFPACLPSARSESFRQDLRALLREEEWFISCCSSQKGFDFLFADSRLPLSRLVGKEWEAFTMAEAEQEDEVEEEVVAELMEWRWLGGVSKPFSSCVRGKGDGEETFEAVGVEEEAESFTMWCKDVSCVATLPLAERWSWAALGGVLSNLSSLPPESAGCPVRFLSLLDTAVLPTISCTKLEVAVSAPPSFSTSSVVVVKLSSSSETTVCSSLLAHPIPGGEGSDRGKLWAREWVLSLWI